MPVFRSACMLMVMMGLAAEFARVAPPATWSWFQAQEILAVDGDRQRQLDILDRELEKVRGMTTEPAA